MKGPTRIWAATDTRTWVEDYPGVIRRHEEEEYVRADIYDALVFAAEQAFPWLSKAIRTHEMLDEFLDAKRDLAMALKIRRPAFCPVCEASTEIMPGWSKCGHSLEQMVTGNWPEFSE